jgi:hypothetical protein
MIYVLEIYVLFWKKWTPWSTQTLDIEVQNNMHSFYLPYLGYNKIIIFPVLKSDNTTFYTPNHE